MDARFPLHSPLSRVKVHYRKREANMFYTVAKREDGWHVVDSEGYDISYVSYDTKREALESARIYTQEAKDHDRREANACTGG